MNIVRIKKPKEYKTYNKSKIFDVVKNKSEYNRKIISYFDEIFFEGKLTDPVKNKSPFPYIFAQESIKYVKTKNGRFEYFIYTRKLEDWDDVSKEVFKKKRSSLISDKRIDSFKLQITLKHDTVNDIFSLKYRNIEIKTKLNALKLPAAHYVSKPFCFEIIFRCKNKTTLVSRNGFIRYLSLKNIRSYSMFINAELLESLLYEYAGSNYFKDIKDEKVLEKLSNKLIKNSYNPAEFFERLRIREGHDALVKKFHKYPLSMEVKTKLLLLTTKSDINKINQILVDNERKIRKSIDFLLDNYSLKEIYNLNLLSEIGIVKKYNSNELENPINRNKFINEILSYRLYINNFWLNIFSYILNIEDINHNKEIVNDYVKMCFLLNKKVNLNIKSFKRLEQEHDIMSAEIQLLDAKEIEVDKVYSRINIKHDLLDFELIDNVKRLALEGIMMKNCVLSYADDINNSSCSIFHINIKDKERFKNKYGFIDSKDNDVFIEKGFTMEIGFRLNDDIGSFFLKQVNGFRNECSFLRNFNRFKSDISDSIKKCDFKVSDQIKKKFKNNDRLLIVPTFPEHGPTDLSFDDILDSPF